MKPKKVTEIMKIVPDVTGESVDSARRILLKWANGLVFESYMDAAEEADLHNGCIDQECLDRGGQCGVTIANRLRSMRKGRRRRGYDIHRR